MTGSGQIWHLDKTLDIWDIQRVTTWVYGGELEFNWHAWCQRDPQNIKCAVKKTELSVSVEWCFALFDFRRVTRTGASYISDEVWHVSVGLWSLNSFSGSNVCHMDVFATESLVCEQHRPRGKLGLHPRPTESESAFRKIPGDLHARPCLGNFGTWYEYQFQYYTNNSAGNRFSVRGQEKKNKLLLRVEELKREMHFVIGEEKKKAKFQGCWCSVIHRHKQLKLQGCRGRKTVFFPEIGVTSEKCFL